MFFPSDGEKLASGRSIESFWITHASLCGSGMLDSTLLISEGPKPVAVRLCLGLVNSGPTGPFSSEMGAFVEGLRSRVDVEVAIDPGAAYVVVNVLEKAGPRNM